jgi:DNA-binding transcriptional regulator YiaG
VAEGPRFAARASVRTSQRNSPVLATGTSTRRSDLFARPDPRPQSEKALFLARSCGFAPAQINFRWPPPKPLKGVALNYCLFVRHVAHLVERMNRTTPDPKQKRERFRELAQTGKVKTGKVFAADIRLRLSKVSPIVHKLTAWRKANRLSQRKAVAVLGNFYFHVTFASLRSWEEGRRSPNPHTAKILEKFLSDHPTVDHRKK